MNRSTEMGIHAIQYCTISRFRLVLRLVCVGLSMLLAGHTKSSAQSWYPSATGNPFVSSALVTVPETAEGASTPDPVLSTGTEKLISQPSSALDDVSDVRDATDSRVPYWNGVWRDTGILFGSQFVVAGIIYVMPESFSSWSDEQKKDSFNKYAKNVLDPVIDKDSFYINYVLHPYWGGTYYIRARERGLDKVQSFVYSALISAMYEFGVECIFEKPSIQDLVVTPVAGTLVGGLFFEPWRESIKRKPELRWYDHAALAITDPVGVLSLGFEKMFGITPTIKVDFTSPQFQKRSAGPSISSKGTHVGIALQFQLD